MAKGKKTKSQSATLIDAAASNGALNGDDHTSEAVKSLTRQVIEQRIIRLTRQNRKLEFEIQRQEQTYGDVEQMKRDALRCNAVVKQSLYGMAGRISEQLSSMTDPALIQQFVIEQMNICFNDLAYEHGRTTSPDE